MSAANKVIERNTERHTKNMKAQFHHDHVPTFFFPYDEEEEATMIVRDIKEKVQAGASPSDFSILYRTHASSRAVLNGCPSQTFRSPLSKMQIHFMNVGL